MPADNITNGRLGAVTAITVDTSAQSHAVATDVCRVASSVACHVAFGTNPTATTSDPYMPAGVEYFRMNPGEKVALIKAAGASAGVGSVSTVH